MKVGDKVECKEKVTYKNTSTVDLGPVHNSLRWWYNKKIDNKHVKFIQVHVFGNIDTRMSLFTDILPCELSFELELNFCCFVLLNNV